MPIRHILILAYINPHFRCQLIIFTINATNRMCIFDGLPILLAKECIFSHCQKKRFCKAQNKNLYHETVVERNILVTSVNIYYSVFEFPIKFS